MRDFACMKRDDWKDIGATRRLWCLLNEAQEEGVHSIEAERLIWSKNAPQRAKDIATKGVSIFKASERRNGKAGVRWWLGDFAPDFAVPVPANGSEGGSGPLDSSAAVSLSAVPTLEDSILAACSRVGRSELTLAEYEQPELVARAA